MTERDRERERETNANKEFRALGGYPPKGLEARALGLHKGLSHSASLCLIGIVLKVSLRFAAFDSNFLKVVAAKTNWRGKHMECKFKTTSLLPNQKYEFKILLV